MKNSGHHCGVVVVLTKEWAGLVVEEERTEFILLTCGDLLEFNKNPTFYNRFLDLLLTMIMCPGCRSSTWGFTRAPYQPSLLPHPIPLPISSWWHAEEDSIRILRLPWLLNEWQLIDSPAAESPCFSCLSLSPVSTGHKRFMANGLQCLLICFKHWYCRGSRTKGEKV